MFRGFSLLAFMFGCLTLISCGNSDHDSARIPPPYSADFNKRKDEDRLAFLTECIRRKIDPAGSYYKRASIYLERGDYETALTDVNQAIASKDNVGEYYLLRGIINRELDRLDPAFQDAERAEALQQKSPKLYILMADILQENKKYTEATRYINGVLALAPFDASVYYVQGMLQTKTGDTLQGLASIEKALDLNPTFFRAYQRASAIYRLHGDYGNAQRIVYNGLKHFDSNSELLVEMARMYADRTIADSALIYYSRAVQNDKENLDVLAEMATVYTKAKNYSSALSTYEEIQRKKSTYPSINYLIGFSQEKLWRLNVAKSYYEKELEITPGYVPARNGLWRISQLENERSRSQNEDVDGQETVKTLDEGRLNITPIQPRNIQN